MIQSDVDILGRQEYIRTSIPSTIILLPTFVTVSCNKCSFEDFVFTSSLCFLPLFFFWISKLVVPRSTRSWGVYAANSKPYSWQEASRIQA